MSANLKNKIKNAKANIAVIGLGYVGLPLAVNFAKVGFEVFGVDKDKDRVEKIQRKESYILDIPSSEIAKVVKKGKFSASMDFENLSSADVIIICVPTPLKRKYTPDPSYIVSAVKAITTYVKKNTLIVLESTTYPGTTEELIQPELEKSGFKANKDFYLAFSPERIDPGNKHYDVAMMCHKLGIDIWEVIDAAKTKPFGFMPFYPGLGVGGHCIPDDPLYLYWKAKHH